MFDWIHQVFFLQIKLIFGVVLLLPLGTPGFEDSSSPDIPCTGRMHTPAMEEKNEETNWVKFF